MCQIRETLIATVLIGFSLRLRLILSTLTRSYAFFEKNSFSLFCAKISDGFIHVSFSIIDASGIYTYVAIYTKKIFYIYTNVFGSMEQDTIIITRNHISCFVKIER